MAVSIVRAGVRWIEHFLSRRYHVFEFSAEPDNILRVARMNSWREVVLSDGTVIHQGDALLVLHLWNERLPSPWRDDVNLGWRTLLGYNLRASARLLARYLTEQSEFDDVCAIYGEMGLIAASQIKQAQRVAARFGFDLLAGEQPGWKVWRYAFWQNAFSWWLVWTFNPASLKGMSLAELQRCEIWASRAQFMRQYARERRNPDVLSRS